MGVCVREGVPELWGNPCGCILPLAHSRFKEEDVPGADMSRQGLWEPLSQNFKAKKAVLTRGAHSKSCLPPSASVVSSALKSQRPVTVAKEGRTGCFNETYVVLERSGTAGTFKDGYRCPSLASQQLGRQVSPQPAAAYLLPTSSSNAAPPPSPTQPRGAQLLHTSLSRYQKWWQMAKRGRRIERGPGF